MSRRNCFSQTLFVNAFAVVRAFSQNTSVTYGGPKGVSKRGKPISGLEAHNRTCYSFVVQAELPADKEDERTRPAYVRKDAAGALMCINR